MDLGHADGKLDVHYDERLVTLIREVRQLTGMGFVIPAKIQHTAKTASKFYKQAVVLKQVNFQTFLQQDKFLLLFVWTVIIQKYFELLSS